jgi:hypothetical protein
MVYKQFVEIRGLSKSSVIFFPDSFQLARKAMMLSDKHWIIPYYSHRFA